MSQSHQIQSIERTCELYSTRCCNALNNYVLSLTPGIIERKYCYCRNIKFSWVSEAKNVFRYADIELPSAIGHIKNILSQYPDSGQIIKELIQNAEDAGASKVDVVHDTRSLEFPEAHKDVQCFIRGPALCLYNDAVFSQEDWNGVRKLLDSIKKDDPLRVGQFGLGFKSVFHISDYITIISGSQLLFMDPSAPLLFIDLSTPVNRMCRFVSLSDLGKVLPESIALQLWGTYLTSQHILTGTFPATLFWFPLRQQPSQLSPTVYTKDRVRQLFDSFSVEAPICLTFLRALEQVSLQRVERDPRTPVLVHQVGYHNHGVSVARQERKNLRHILHQCEGRPSTSITSQYQVTIHNTKDGQVSKQTMLVLHYLPGQQDKYCIKYKGNEPHRYIPLVGVAVPTQPIATSWAQGSLFTFLPLPLDPANATGLPVHVNAYFTLDQNRRHVKWRTHESSKEPDTHGFLTTQNVITDASLEDYSNQVNTCVKEVLKCYQKPLVTLPSHVTISLDRLNSTPPTVTPALVRECLRSGGGKVKCDCDTITLLEYITSDQHYHNQLNGLQLLPLNDGSWSTYSTNSTSHPIYICTSNEAEALWGLQSYILQLNLSSVLHSRSSNVEHEALISAIDLNTLQPDVKKFLAKLNIFISVRECGNIKNDCVKRVIYIIPPDLVDFPVHFPVAILKHQTTRHQQLAITLGAELLSKEKLCLLALSSRNTYSEGEMCKLALYILSDNNLMTNTSVCQWLKALRFVSDVSGVLHLPGELYDPKDDDIDALIDEDLTPSRRFHQYLPSLVKLGLKKVIDLPQHLLIQVITHVQSPSINTEEKTRKSLALLRVLEQRQDYKAVCMAVRDVAFVYGVTVKPSDYPVHLGWETKPHLLTPTSLKSYSKYKDVLGSVIQLIDCSHLSKVAKGFNWNMDPDTSNFCDHFRNMITAYQSSTRGCFEMSKKIYKYLSKIVKSSEDHNLECLSDLPCVFTEYGFKFSHQVFLQPAVGDVILLPYIYPLPYELREWTDLFVFLGCFVNQSKDLYLKFIRDVQDYHNTDAEDNVHQDRKMVVSVLEKLDKYVDDIPPSELLLPVENDDDSLELVKKELCSYSDQHCDWLSSDDLEVRIVHKCIPLKLAQSLGVKQLSQHLLLGGETMMEWGQNEQLTTSLNNLLHQYRDGVAIMKELVQNADDAGATTVSFLYDERQNEDARTRLLSRQLEEWQGPALWAYNDATFTEDDFKNLRKLGGEMRDGLTLHMIDHVDAYMESLQGVASIPTHPYGKLRDPRDLICPKSQVAKMYSESDERFPQDKFTQTSNRCDVLLDLGMKSKTIPAEWVKERACSVVQSVCSQCALHRSSEILYYMATQDDEKQNAIASKLKTLPFLPVMIKPLKWQYAWKGDENMSKQSKLCSSHTSHIEKTVTFTNPSDLYSSHFKELVGSTELILSPNQGKNKYKVQESVLDKLGVTVDYLPLESVIE
ncbi:hypothetical protein Pcinc_001178 [Petrolisthes cinctipes]|uniref:Sacsin/Nov domain-containing protein n=1 Tax=Petrolisthes cinctipes TaxID=88211 RepID=A0AAE1GRI5_PETCI|nr:hypothetical protein Pcinc_001178 [Petrolisthes cinctipes]